MEVFFSINSLFTDELTLALAKVTKNYPAQHNWLSLLLLFEVGSHIAQAALKLNLLCPKGDLGPHPLQR